MSITKNDYSNALSYVKKGLEFCDPNCSSQVTIIGMNALGMIYYKLDSLLRSKFFFNTPLSIAKKEKNQKFQVENLIYLSKIFFKLGNYSQVKQALLEAEKISIEMRYNELLLDTYQQFTKLYDTSNEFKKANKYYLKYNNLRESIYSQELTTSLYQIETEYSERENKAKITHQQEVLKLQEETVRRQQLIIALVGVSVLLLIIIVSLLYRSNRMRKRVNILLEDKVQERTHQLQESHSIIVTQSEERNKELVKAYNELNASAVTLKGIVHVGKQEAGENEVKEYFAEAEKTVDQLTDITNKLRSLSSK